MISNEIIIKAIMDEFAKSKYQVGIDGMPIPQPSARNRTQVALH